MKKIILSAVGLLTAMNALSQAGTGPATITRIGSGWNADQAGIFLSVPIPNPAGCAYADQVLVDASTPGYKVHLALALTAFAQNKTFFLIVSNTSCSSHGRPALIGAAIQ